MKIRPLIFAAICSLSFLSVSCSGETSTSVPQASSGSSGGGTSPRSSSGSQAANAVLRSPVGCDNQGRAINNNGDLAFNPNC